MAARRVRRQVVTVSTPAEAALTLVQTGTAPALSVSGAIVVPVLAVATPVTAATYTVLATDTYIVFNTGATCTLTLPTPSAINAGRALIIKTIAAFAVNSASSNVKPQTTNTNGTAILAATAGRFAQLVSDGTSWVVMQSN